MAAKNVKLVTFSMDERSINRLAELQTFMHIANKSAIMCKLIDDEWLRQQELREGL